MTTTTTAGVLQLRRHELEELRATIRSQADAADDVDRIRFSPFETVRRGLSTALGRFSKATADRNEAERRIPEVEREIERLSAPGVDDLKRLRQACDAADARTRESFQKVLAAERELGAVREVLAALARANATLVALEGRFLIDPTTVTQNALQAARDAAAAARKGAAVAEPKIGPLEHALGLLRADLRAREQEAAEPKRALHAAKVARLRALNAEAFEQFDAAFEQIHASVVKWNAVDELRDELEPPDHPPMRFTGHAGFVAVEMPAGPDKRFAAMNSSREFAGFLSGWRHVIVKPAEIALAKQRIRDELADGEQGAST